MLYSFYAVDNYSVLTLQFFTVIEVNRQRSISVGIPSMLSDTYNNIYEPVNDEIKRFTLMQMLCPLDYIA